MTAQIAAVKWIARHWLAVHITTAAAAVLQVALLLQALSRGLDYVIPPYNPSFTTAFIERAIPIHLSGWIFCASAVLALAGLVLRTWPVTALGHMTIAVMYGVFGVGALVEVVNRDTINGWRTATAWLIACISHVVFAKVSENAWRTARAE